MTNISNLATVYPMMTEDPTAVLLQPTTQQQQQQQQMAQCGNNTTAAMLSNALSPTASTTNSSSPDSPAESGLGRQQETADPLSSNRPLLDLRSANLASSPPQSFNQSHHAAPSSSSSVGASSIDLRRQLCDQNVFVFHLPSEWAEEDLRREFGRYGSILSCKVVKRPDGSSKGYGFVCFNENSAAFASVEAMNGRPFGGKRLKVSLKKTPEECLHLQVQKLMEISNANQPYDRDRDCTLFVFHLPSTWDDKDIYQHFQSFGTLLSAKIAKKDDSASRGYGFVTYDNPRAAALAIANMNGVEVGHNKRLKVQLKQQSNPPQPVPGCTIFTFHLPNDWTDNHLRQHFSHFGKILGATVQRDSLGNSRGYGFVSFDRQRSALNAVIGMNGFSVGHKRLKVSLKRGDDRYAAAAVVAAAQNTARDVPTQQAQQAFFPPSDINYWDAAAAAADFAAVHAAAAHNQLQANQTSNRNQLPTAMQQAFAASRQPYAAVNAVNDASHRIPSLHQMTAAAPNYPSTASATNSNTAAGFSFPQHHGHQMNHTTNHALTSAAAYSSYLPHWNAPTDLGLGR